METAKKVLNGLAIAGLIATLGVILFLPGSDQKTFLGRILLLASAAIFDVGNVLDFIRLKKPGKFTAQDGTRLGIALGMAVIIVYGLVVTLK